MDSSKLKFLQEHLANRQASWVADHTPLVDIDPQARRSMHGAMPAPGERSFAERERAATAAHEDYKAAPPVAPAYPSMFNWGAVAGRNFISPIKDQGLCGSCVAFGVAAATDATMRICCDIAVNDASGTNLQDVAEAQLFYCSTTDAPHDCASGWYINSAMRYAAEAGLAPEVCYPYSPGNQTGSLPQGWEGWMTRISGSHVITEPAEMKQWLATRGPLVTMFSVYEDIYAYKGGVYTRQYGANEGGHCVCCIGYDDGADAWLCKNSWGTEWGDGGYLWIGYGQCGIDAEMVAIDGLSTVQGTQV